MTDENGHHTVIHRLYVAGPMSGLPEFNRPAFFAAARTLNGAGYDAVNPARREQNLSLTWAEYMEFGLLDLLSCEGVAVLDDWLNSRGAWLEVTVARELGKPVRTISEWLIEAT